MIGILLSLFLAHVSSRFNAKSEQVYANNKEDPVPMTLFIVPVGIVCAYFYYILRSDKNSDSDEQ